MAQRTKRDNYADSYQARVNKGEYRPLGTKEEEQVARKLVIRALYAIPREDRRRKEIRRHEIACILGVSDSTLGRAIGGDGLEEIHGRKVPAERILKQSRDVASRKKKEQQQEEEGVDQCYDLDKFHDVWLKKASPDKRREIEGIIRGPEPQMPPLSQTRTLSQAEAELWAVVFNKRGEIDTLKGEINKREDQINDLLRAIQAGKTVGLLTLADAMTKYTWASAKRREQARKVWLRILATEQKRIDKYLELDRQRAIKTKRSGLEHALPLARPSGHRPPRLGERRL